MKTESVVIHDITEGDVSLNTTGHTPARSRMKIYELVRENFDLERYCQDYPHSDGQKIGEVEFDGDEPVEFDLRSSIEDEYRLDQNKPA